MPKRAALARTPESGGSLEALLPAIRAIPASRAKRPSQPVDSFVQEALNLANWAGPDREPLERAGLEWHEVEAIPARAAALSEAQAKWLARRFGHAEAAERWQAAEVDAYRMRDDLLANLRHAFRKQPTLLKRVAAITKGKGDEDMIQDLNDIAVVGGENFKLLARISVTRADLATAAKMYDELAGLLAASKGDTTDERAKMLRNRAFAYLKEAVQEVRACGRHAFRKDPQRLKRYISDYERGRRSRKKKKSSHSGDSRKPAAG